MRRIVPFMFGVLVAFYAVSSWAAGLDNVWFSGVTSTISGTIGIALTSVVTLAALILGAVVGFRLYKRIAKR